MKGVDVNHQTLLIIGKIFFVTTNTCINCCMGVVEVSLGKKRVRLNIFNSIMGPSSNKCISILDVGVDEAAHDMIASIVSINSYGIFYKTMVDSLELAMCDIYLAESNIKVVLASNQCNRFCPSFEYWPPLEMWSDTSSLESLSKLEVTSLQHTL